MKSIDRVYILLVCLALIFAIGLTINFQKEESSQASEFHLRKK